MLQKKQYIPLNLRRAVIDRVSNCKEWIAAGGDAYLISHQNYETILEELSNKLIKLKNHKTVLDQIILD